MTLKNINKRYHDKNINVLHKNEIQPCIYSLVNCNVKLGKKSLALVIWDKTIIYIFKCTEG